MGALSFSTPLLLLALVALPAIWFLLRATPPSPLQVKFPAFELLRRLSKTPETPERTPWWILLMRLAIAGLAIIGLAGPILNAPPPPAGAGPLLILVDDSWAAAPGWRLRRDTIESAAEQAMRAERETFLVATTGADERAPAPMTGEELRDAARALQPAPLLPDYARTRLRVEALAGSVRDADILWLSDGLAHAGTAELAAALNSLGAVSLHVDGAAPLLALRPPTRAESSVAYTIDNVGAAPWRGDIVALARDGRELARTTIEIAANRTGVAASLDLPLALQNDMSQARLDAVSSAGGVQLVDVRDRRTMVGFVASGEASVDPLLSGAHYVRKALAPYANFVADSVEGLIAAQTSVIVLDDVGVLRPGDVDLLRSWIDSGGVLLRFAGPTLAEAAAEASPPLLPVPLRGGGRAFGGALTWETPQLLATFSADGPFAGLVPPKDVFVRRQVLAEPGGDTSARSWASLADGTPLVTGEQIGAGAVALFHTTATPDWSDLPLSALFSDMLRRVVFLSALGPESLGDEAAQRVTPFRILDGFGALTQPSRDSAPQTLADLAAGPAPGRPPGLYGAPEAPIALNAVGAAANFKPVSSGGLATRPYVTEPPARIGPPLFLIAIILLIADGLMALRLAGRLPLLATMLTLMALAPLDAARAQPLERPIESAATQAALAMRLAFVRTGDPTTDRIAEAGLRGLTLELTRRTSSEPVAPAGVDPETDDLSVYPFLYWPMTPGAAAPSERALANIENFIRFGGLIVFDTRDDERAISGVDTPEAVALKTIVAGLDLPPLSPLAGDHVLYRSFYLLSDLPGRMATRPVWAQAGEGPNDSVTPVIIGGRDWAGAWATNAAGEPLLPTTASGRPCAAIEGAAPRPLRECAYRAGVNMVMVALTGNYKSDQVHTPTLLERLGRQ